MDAETKKIVESCRGYIEEWLDHPSHPFNNIEIPVHSASGLGRIRLDRYTFIMPTNDPSKSWLIKAAVHHDTREPLVFGKSELLNPAEIDDFKSRIG